MMAHTTFSSHYIHDSIHKKELVDLGIAGQWESDDPNRWALFGMLIGMWVIGIIISIVILC